MVAEVPRCDHVCTRMQLPSPHPQLKLIMISSFRVWACLPFVAEARGAGGTEWERWVKFGEAARHKNVQKWVEAQKRGTIRSRR